MRRRNSLATRIIALAGVAASTVVLSGTLLAQDAAPPAPKTPAPLDLPKEEPKGAADIALPPSDPNPLPPATVPPPEPIRPSPGHATRPQDPSDAGPDKMPLKPPPRELPTQKSPFELDRLDPEADANTFVERSVKEADTVIKSLSAEAESLKARLQKVEAGLERWKAVKSSLESNSRNNWHSGRGSQRSTNARKPDSFEDEPALDRPTRRNATSRDLPGVSTALEPDVRPTAPVETAPTYLEPTPPNSKPTNLPVGIPDAAKK